MVRSVEQVVETIKPQLDRVLSTTGGKLEVNTRLQSLLKYKAPDVFERSLHETILRHAIASEKMGPGSLQAFIDHVASPSVTVGASQVMGRHMTIDDVSRVVDSCTGMSHSFVGCMVKEALSLAGFGGRIIVEKTSSSVPSVELVRGYTFEIQPGFPVDFSFTRPRVVCIDGFIEEVSEVHHLLEAAASTRESCVIFLRGASLDVIHTLRVNYDRGTLRVVPMIVRFDLEGMNTLVDISTVVGTDVVSSLKGELISSIVFSNLPVAEQITAFKGSTVIVEGSTARAVKTHVDRLRRRREDEEVVDVGRLLDSRVRSLSPNHVVIRVPADREFIVNSQAIDTALRTVRSCIERGLDECGNPVVASVAAQFHAKRCRETLDSLGAAVI